MKIKNFTELNEIEKKNVFELSEKTNITNSNIKEILNYYQSIIFDSGKSFFTFWDNEKLIATIGNIVKDIKYKGEAFITSINIDDENINYFPKILKESENYIKTFNPKIIKLGINYNKKSLIPYLEKENYINPYELNIMEFAPNKIYDLTEIDLESLSLENKDIFRKINNNAFSDCPNGGILSDIEMNDFLEKYKDQPELMGVFKYQNKYVGSFELTLKDKTGIIESIGIYQDFQGKGLGKLLLTSVINKLQKLGAQKIELSVISTNTKAVNLYKNYGFKTIRINSIWFEKIL